jgi:hypothetical protein
MFVFNDGKTNRVSGLVREGETDPFIPDLEVLEINPVARSVRVTFGGRELTMDFVKDGLMPPTNQVALAGAGAHGRPGTQVAMATGMQRPSGGVIQPGIQPASVGGGTTTSGRSIPARPSRLGAGLSPTARQGVSVSGGGIGGGDVQGAPNLSPEQQNQLIREQVNFGQQINLEMPPVPPAPGLEDLSGPPPMPGGVPQLPYPPAPQ